MVAFFVWIDIREVFMDWIIFLFVVSIGIDKTTVSKRICPRNIFSSSFGVGIGNLIVPNGGFFPMFRSSQFIPGVIRQAVSIFILHHIDSGRFLVVLIGLSTDFKGISKDCKVHSIGILGIILNWLKHVHNKVTAKRSQS